MTVITVGLKTKNSTNSDLDYSPKSRWLFFPDSKNNTLNRSETEKRETENRLDALEKSLAAASQSIMASSPWQQQQQQHQQQQMMQQRQEMRQYETRSYETKTEQRQEQRQEQRHEQRFEQQSVSRQEMNGGYPRSMSPTWDNYPLEHVSSVTLFG